jgi:hypothetical protein
MTARWPLAPLVFPPAFASIPPYPPNRHERALPTCRWLARSNAARRGLRPRLAETGAAATWAKVELKDAQSAALVLLVADAAPILGLPHRVISNWWPTIDHRPGIWHAPPVRACRPLPPGGTEEATGEAALARTEYAGWIAQEVGMNTPALLHVSLPSVSSTS